MAKVLHFDCISGISGDMALGALIAAGADRSALQHGLASLPLEGFELRIEETRVNGIGAVDVEVVVAGKRGHPHRNLKTIESIIDESGIPLEAKRLARDIFRCLAEAEAKVHRCAVDEVGFHEVGAVDSIVDIIGTAVCVDLIRPDRISSSSLPMGRGMIECAHGLIPIPAPATVEVLKGVPIRDFDVEAELVTPTGAAIVKTLATEYGSLPAMRIQSCGYGAGKKRFEHPNLLRVFTGETEQAPRSERLSVLECNIDDMSPEIYSYLLPHLMQLGALDVFLTNVLMKKGRPGAMLTVLCRLEREVALREALFRETTTLGVRCSVVDRLSMRRRSKSIDTEFGAVRVKVVVGLDGGEKMIAEYEECRRIASERDMPLREVYERINAGLHGR